MLVLMLAANTFTFLFYTMLLATQRSLAHAPPRALTVLLLGGVANLIGLIALWQWRAWGLYLLAASAVLVLAYNIALGISALMACLGLLGPIIVSLLLRPVWHHLR